jgi:hypothetical protein
MTIASLPTDLGERTYHEGPSFVRDDVGMHYRFYTYETDAGLVFGVSTSVMFTVDHPARVVWPIFKDFNQWQSSHHFYSGVIGDLEGQSFRISSSATPGQWGNTYDVIKVIPEYAIVISQPVPTDGSNGGISRGFHIFQLSEHGGKSLATIFMEHANRRAGATVAEGLAYWLADAMVPTWTTKWRDSFIPTLKKRVREAASR